MSVPRQGFARRHGVDPGELEVRDGFLGIEQPGPSAPGRSSGEHRRGRPRPRLQQDDALGRQRAALPTARSLGPGEARRGHARRARIRSATASRTGRWTSRRRGVRDAPTRRRRRARCRPSGGARSSRGCRRDGAIPPAVLDEVVHLVEWPVVLESAFDARFLDLPRDVVIAAMQSHQRYFPLEGNRFAFVSNGGDPDVVRAGNTQVLENRLDDAAFSFERDVKVGDRRTGRRASEESRSSKAAARSPTRSNACRSWPGGSVGERRRSRRRGSPRPTRPPSSCASSRSWRAGSAPSTRAWPAIPRQCAPPWPSSTFPTRPGAASLDRERPRPLRGGQDRHPHHLVLAGPSADGLARPLRPAPRRDRALPARRPRAPSRFRGHCSRGRSPISSRSGSRGCSTSRSSSSAPLAAPRSRSSARSRSSPRRSHGWTTRRSTGSTPPTRAPIGWPVAPRRRLRS